MSGEIFISYRREESGWVAGRLRDRLQRSFDPEKIFMDVDAKAIPLGANFKQVIEKEHLKAEQREAEQLEADQREKERLEGERVTSEIPRVSTWITTHDPTQAGSRCYISPSRGCRWFADLPADAFEYRSDSN